MRFVEHETVPDNDRTLDIQTRVLVSCSRLERGLSQESLGFQSGYHRTYISLLERGQKNPSLRTIFQLADVLEVAVDEITRRVGFQMASEMSGNKGEKGKAV